MSSQTINLGYWGFPLRAQPIRYIFELAQYPYQQTNYTFEGAKDWFEKDKKELGLDFPNLPYLIHGDFKITESQNIISYALDITKQHHLLGFGLIRFKIDNIRFLCDELIAKTFLASTKTGEEKKAEINNSVIPKFKSLQAVLGNKKFFFEDKLTLADIYAYTAINAFQHLLNDEYKQFAQAFGPFMKNFEEVPLIKAYHSSNRYPKFT
ncbi:glutathione S-transferase, amine-terminal domain protein (macronuclear) [Tetrahymena thermophila SB210]|uniref:glutathione transferase n=1 Tax=Tetrahymena thermophila (strain SB210) TaxID=312017 RepID=Q22N86_TETTS|nr:glutathione S-transferase, amine-terminal domain protein [Tetrahymena thermophila SB210]EAR86899.1 glutathione S-transferase, amine-terminal domain protein [Tetrahymena thermophila SB210]|eukprot:XP_001007144.1 glutathione S-transferase, amine-terminal domain protein [Tetrahymena thermophila SB210]